MNHLNSNTFESDINRPNIASNRQQQQQTPLLNASSSLINAINEAMDIETPSQLFRPNTRSFTKYHQQQQLVDSAAKMNKPQPTYQKIIVNEKNCNIINLIENSRINSRMPKQIANVRLTHILFVKFFFYILN